jgi:hemerythrin-like domain-containing protein
LLFWKGFEDGCHYQKEEEILFPALIESGLSKDNGPVAMMVAEHAESRRLAQVMRQMTDRYQGGDELARAQVVKSAMGYIQLLRKHIYKEDNYLYPMASKVIPIQRQEKLYDALTRVDYDEDGEEIHEKYRNLVERLERECLRTS